MTSIEQYLETYYDEVSPIEFYRAVFPAGELEEKGVYEEGRYTGIAVEVLPLKPGEKKPVVHRYSITDGLEIIEYLQRSKNFCILSPISYAGKARTSEHARFLYALTFDLDGIVVKDDGTPQGLIDLFQQIEVVGRLPMPTYMVSSGTGLHLYYLFEKPIPLFRNIVKQLQAYKRRLTELLWNGYITTLSDEVQQESLFQGFRAVGTRTKQGGVARAFETGQRVTMEELNKYVEAEYRVTQFTYKSRLTKEEAQRKYPEWYQARVVEKKPKGHWITKRDLYDWWLRRIKTEAKVGHRYYCLMILSVYAMKAGISQEELEKDAFDLVAHFDSLTTDEANHFDMGDALDALEAYNDRYITYPITSITHLTQIHIEKNKRNFLPQKVHLEAARARKAVLKKAGLMKPEGRPATADGVLREYLIDHPGASQAELHRETGVSYATIRKYYDQVMVEVSMYWEDDETTKREDGYFAVQEDRGYFRP